MGTARFIWLKVREMMLAILPFFALGALSSPPIRQDSRPYTIEQVNLDSAHRLLVYRPKKSKHLSPLVLIAPAGTPLFFGMSLGQGDMPEQIPYAEAGCIVVAYDVSGPYQKGQGNQADSIRTFLNAGAGTLDGKRALNYALKKIPGVDPSRVIVAGHSSAATIALQLAEADSRVRACIAYAPIVNVPADLGRNLSQLERMVPGFGSAIARSSPSSHVAKLKCPLFLFHADDDTRAPFGPIRQLASAVPHGKLVTVPTGGHYDSMLHEGVPMAIQWLRGLGLIQK